MRLPSLTALQMLEASARLGSFTRAAQELSVTESAVCRQIQGLESRFGVLFFNRINKRLILTVEGERYIRNIRHELNNIERATKELAARADGREVIELSVVPTFGTQWLIPRLQSLAKQHPRLILNISSRPLPFDFPNSTFDAAIYSGPELWAGTTGKQLLSEGPCVVVCSPQLLTKRKKIIQQPADLLAYPLLHLRSRPDAWGDWIGGQDEELRHKASLGARFDLFTMVIRAAQENAGLALVPKMLVKEELERGLLISPISQTSNQGLPNSTYFISHRTDKQSLTKIQGFLNWLDEEILNSQSLMIND